MWNVPQEAYKNVVAFWPVVGWLTGGISVFVLLMTAEILPFTVSVTLMFLVRILLTGALHDDGLADFCDGFGGGTSRERILAIMKDSHIGTYGVIGLIFYYLTAIGLVSSLPLHLAAPAVFVGDVWSKFCAGRIIDFLPYARTAEQAKNKLVYNHLSVGLWIMSFVFGAFPLILFGASYYLLAALCPMIVSALLILLMKKKIQGYTGDCCGATFLLSELSFFLGIVIVNHLI